MGDGGSMDVPKCGGLRDEGLLLLLLTHPGFGSFLLLQLLLLHLLLL
jgi:hypothetical protein